MPQRTINPKNILCTFPSCGRAFSNKAGLTNHLRTHRTPLQDPPSLQHRPSPSPAPQEMAPEPGHMEEDPIKHKPPPEQAPEHPNTGPTPKRQEKITYHPYINGKKNLSTILIILINTRTPLRCRWQFSAPRGSSSSLGLPTTGRLLSIHQPRSI